MALSEILNIFGSRSGSNLGHAGYQWQISQVGLEVLANQSALAVMATKCRGSGKAASGTLRYSVAGTLNPEFLHPASQCVGM